MTRRVPEEFITTIRDKKGGSREFVRLAGLLELAHQDGFKRLETQCLQFPSQDNSQLCIVHAAVETDKGVFTGMGDASPSNVTEWIVPHIVRMAETRAVARALRFATNVAMTAFEELSDAEGGTVLPQRVDPPARELDKPTYPRVKSSYNQATEAQLRAIHSIGDSQGMSLSDLNAFARRIFNSPVENLDKSQASTVIRELKTQGNGRR